MEPLTGSVFIGSGLLQAAITAGLFLWGSAVAVRRQARIWWWARWMPLLALIVSTVGVIGTVVRLVLAFDAVRLVGPQDRALRLADGISEATGELLVTLILSAALYLASIALFTVGTVAPPPAGAPAPRTAPPAAVPPPG